MAAFRVRIPVLLSIALMVGACQTVVPASSPMVERASTTPPGGFIDYCRRNPADCSEVAQLAAEPPALDARRFEQLADVHWQTVTSIRYVSDRELYGREEHWALPRDSGDCEDMVLAMRRRLIDLGWPASALRMTMAVTETGGNHLVLVVTTRDGDYVLDNRRRRVEPWAALPYTWVKRQTVDLGRWTELQTAADAVPPAVAATSTAGDHR